MITRRDFIKTTAVGASLLIGGRNTIFGYPLPKERLENEAIPFSVDNPAIQYHSDQCIHCGRCVDFCRQMTGVYQRSVSTGEDPCIHCGQCTLFCTDAITERFHYNKVAEAIDDPEKIVVATTAPAIRVALGEMFGLTPGTNVEKEIVGALKQLGIDHVLDATFSADLTVVEEATELIQRLENKNLEGAMFTDCCPAWRRYLKLFHPHLVQNLSTTKSPTLMQGALIKTYYAEKQGIDPEKIVHVALMPCTAKKGEIRLEGMNAAGVSLGKPDMRDVDYVLTCRELACLLKDRDVDLLQTQGASYDSLMGRGSGSGLIFGNTGGVMEATMRTAYKLLNGTNPPVELLDFHPVRGFDHLRQAKVDLGKYQLNVAVVHGITHAHSFLEILQNGIQKFDFVEVMACPGGCIGGGGQPYVDRDDMPRINQRRVDALYQHDTKQEIRLSIDNPEIKTIYDTFLGHPLSEKSKQFLHVIQGT